jgi:high-affinity K+ transport system ATPase subunit B
MGASGFVSVVEVAEVVVPVEDALLLLPALLVAVVPLVVGELTSWIGCAALPGAASTACAVAGRAHNRAQTKAAGSRDIRRA